MKWILATAGLLVLGLILNLSLLIYAMYVLLGVLLLSRFFTRTWTDQMEAQRFCDGEVVEIGAGVESKVAVRNTGNLSIPWVILEDSLSRDALTQMPPRLKTEGARLALARLPAGETKVLSQRLKFLMRGYYQIGPLLAETGDVFGLHRRFRILTEPHYVLALPKVLPLKGYSLASRRPVGEIRLTHRLFEDPTRSSSIRPYQQGDPLNRIHWRATARAGELQTRTYESSCVSGATFLLDFHTGSFSGASAVNSAELAVVTVASLANAVYLTGGQIGFVSNGRDAADRIREEDWRAEFLTRDDARRRASETPANTRLRPVVVETGKGEDQFTSILAALGRLEQSDGLDFSAMVTEATSRISRDATVVAVLGGVTPGIAVALGDLARRGLLVTAVVVSFGMEAVPDWAKPPSWAEMLLAQGIDFRVVNSEESITDLCAEAIVR
ncbi:MAG: DUF58 domain-containing protein [Verrucomicrobiota bacterium]|jgi:uncharacterized protein (DUF58 family)